MALEMDDGQVLKLLMDQGADIATIKTTVNRLDTLIGNGGGLVRKVDYNREVCDHREVNHQKDRRELWDYIKAHRGKSLIIAGGGASLVSAITEGIRQLWQITHTPATPPAVHPVAVSIVGASGLAIILCAVLSTRTREGENENQ